MPHLSMELLKQRAKVNIVHIPYPAGSQSIHALLGGSVEIAALSPATVLAIDSGQEAQCAGGDREGTLGGIARRSERKRTRIPGRCRRDFAGTAGAGKYSQRQSLNVFREMSLRSFSARI